MLYVLRMTYADGHLTESASADHRAWVERQYEASRFLASGPTTDGVGGIALAVGVDRTDIEALLATDPVVQEGNGSYEVVEVTVTLAAPSLDWLIGN